VIKINIVKNRAASPNLFIIIALSEDLFASLLVNQKLINRYDDKPTPSQPINIWTTLPLVTSNIIKKVNRFKKDMNLI
jgi:hypothetical protein